MTHVLTSDLEAYIQGEAQDAAAIDAHLSSCDDCMAALARAAQLELVMREAGREEATCPGCQRDLDGERCDGCGAVRRAAPATSRYASSWCTTATGGSTAPSTPAAAPSRSRSLPSSSRQPCRSSPPSSARRRSCAASSTPAFRALSPASA